MCGSMVDIQSATAEIRRGNKERRKKKELECGPMPNLITALSNTGGAVCESSIIPFLVPRCKVWLTPAVRLPCSNAPLGGSYARKCVYSVPGHETVKHRAKFGCPPVSDVAAVITTRRETS